VDLAGPDRISETRHSFATRDGHAVSRTEQWVYAEENNATPTLVSTSDTALGSDDRWTETDGQITHSFITRPAVADGSWTATTQQPDGSKTVVYYTAGRASSRSSYDANNVLISSQSTTYDALGRLLTTTDSRDGPTDYTYYADDALETVTAPPEAAGVARRVTHYAYTPLGQQDIITLPDTKTVDNDYWPTGELKKVRGAGQYAQDYEYTAQGRLWKLTTTSGVTEWTYHPGNVAGAGQLKEKIHADGTKQQYTYTTAGRILTKTNARGQVASYFYTTQLGEVTDVTYSDPNTPALHYTYDRLGRTKSGQLGALTRARHHDAFGRPQWEKFTGGTHQAVRLDFGYDAKKRLAKHTLSGHTGAFLANGGLQVAPAQNMLAQPIVHSYGYDDAGRWKSVSDGTHQAEYAYATTGGSVLDHVKHFHQGQHKLTETHAYDNLRRNTGKTLQTAAGATLYGTGYTYNLSGLRDTATQGDKTWGFGYDPDTYEVKSGAKSLTGGNPLPGQQFSYNYDGLGNRSGANGQAGTLKTHAPANNVNQITQIDTPALLPVQGTANPAATLAIPTHPAVPINREADFFQALLPGTTSSQPQSIVGTVEATLAGTTTTIPFAAVLPPTTVFHQYDLDGNLTNDGKFTYTWDAEHRLVSIESVANWPNANPKIRQTHQYDDLSRLTSTLTELWVQGSWEIAAWKAYHYDEAFNRLAETDLSGPANQPTGRTLNQSYLWGPDLGGTRHTAGGVGGLLSITQHKGPLKATYQAFADGNGNILRLTNPTTPQQPAAEYAYGPFGEPLQASGAMGQMNPFRFSTKPTDDFTGLVYYGYRWYSPEIGKWVSRDPIGEEGGVSLYGMVENDVVNQRDKLGLKKHALTYDLSGDEGEWLSFARFGFGLDGRLSRFSQVADDVEAKLRATGSKSECNCVTEITLVTHGFEGVIDPDDVTERIDGFPKLSIEEDQVRFNRLPGVKALQRIDKSMCEGGIVIFTACKAGQSERLHTLLKGAIRSNFRLNTESGYMLMNCSFQRGTTKVKGDRPYPEKKRDKQCGTPGCNY
jgi:RHS repeat-associated protein